MTIGEMREYMGVSREEFSRRYGIPAQTLWQWESGNRKAPGYVLSMLERIVKMDMGEMDETAKKRAISYCAGLMEDIVKEESDEEML